MTTHFPLAVKLAHIERLVPFALVLHGILISTRVNADTYVWTCIGVVFFCGVLGLSRQHCGKTCRSGRLVVLLIVTTYLMWHTGGTSSFFLLWLFVIIAVYPLITPSPYSYLVTCVVVGIYAGLIFLNTNKLPLEVLGSRLLLLGFIGYVVATMSAALRDYRHVQAIANQDPLTGLPNRRYLMDIGEKLRSLSNRSGKPLSVMVVDLDKFKLVNDTYGHYLGDELLCQVAHSLSRTSRSHDIVARTGGDEFVAVLPDTDLQDAKRLEARFRDALANIEITHGERQFGVSASIGSVTSSGRDPLEQIIAQADREMYKHKFHSRSYQPPPSLGSHGLFDTGLPSSRH